MAVQPKRPDADAAVAEQAALLERRYGHLSPLEVLERAVDRYFVGGLAAVSSFGADSAVLLHLIAQVDRNLPVIFLDTGKHFDETLSYRDALIADLGLTDLRIVEPLAETLIAEDPDGQLNATHPDRCCAIRKVEPMARAVEPFRAWLTGRKRFQAPTRASLPAFEAVGPRMRINPLARWTGADIADYLAANRLRGNPLVAFGYLSIGCFPCTQPVQPGEDARSGRWAGQAKTECGIHLPTLDRSLGGAAPGQDVSR